MQAKDNPAAFDPNAEADAAVEAALERAAAGWTAEEVEADAIDADFTPQQAAEIVDEAWTVTL